MADNYNYDDELRADADPQQVRVPESKGGFMKGMRRLKRRVAGILATCFVLAAIAGGVWLYLFARFDAPGPLAQEHAVQIERGQGLREIAELLRQEGVIENDKVFILGVLMNRANGKLKAGEYRFEARDSMRTVMDALVAGRSVQYAITFPEGLTTQQMLDRITQNDVLVGEITDIPEEGSLLPDTYSFTRGMQRQAIVDRMRAAQDKIMAELWPGRDADLPVTRPYEALILASIVEKETGVASERARVAAVFVNRLRRGMRLQSDPTIIYGIVGGEGSLGRPITRADINGVTDYNTYQIDGLPPTPIANPGRASIQAVLHPAETDDVYFVADGTGGHVFAETLEEHNTNVARWREIERARREQEGVVTQADTETVTGSTPGTDAADTMTPDAGIEAASAGDAGDAPETPEEAAAVDDTSAPDEPAPADTEPEATDATDATDTAGDSAAGAEPQDDTPEEAVAIDPDADFPLPEPKPPVPQRQGSTGSVSDVSIVPLPSTSAN